MSINLSLSRLLKPKSICVIGGVWATNVVEQCHRMGYNGDIWPVNVKGQPVSGLKAYQCVEDLPQAPDAVFIGVNRITTIEIVKTLSRMGAGGVVCFASGFSEAAAEDKDAVNLQEDLLEAAGAMPLLGPNCYGFINYLDGALLWPDQHGGKRAKSGVAIVVQSSNIAINLTMQTRGLAIAYVLTVGNQAQMSLGGLASTLLDDERVTALALHIESFGDIRDFEQMAEKARRLGKPIVAIKVGKSVAAQHAMLSHTSSMSGSDAASNAFLQRLGIARLHSLSDMLEILKVLQVTGPLRGNKIASMSCSGGEAGLMADAVDQSSLRFAALNESQHSRLRANLGPMIAIANPLDYNTYIWGNYQQLFKTFSAMMSGEVDLCLLVLDFPRPDCCDISGWKTTIDAVIAAKKANNIAVGVLATVPENMPEESAIELMQAGVVPLLGIQRAIKAIECCVSLGQQKTAIGRLPSLNLAVAEGVPISLDEASAKQMLSDAGLNVPNYRVCSSLEDIEQHAAELSFPVVLKGLGVAHKTEAGVVKVGLNNTAQVMSEARLMQSKVSGYLLEELITDNQAELLVGIIRDETHGFMLTVAAGGIYTELLKDSQHLLLPYTREDLVEMLPQLKIFPLINGFRGSKAASHSSILDTIMLLQNFVLKHQEQLLEVEINPLLCGTQSATIVDALISLTGERP